MGSIAAPAATNGGLAAALKEATRPSHEALGPVLVVDDDADAGEPMRVLLEGGGCLVETAAAGPQALQLLESFRPRVVVSDVGMPEFDGYELARRVRALPPERGGHTPLVALTAHARVEDRARALYAGFNLHVPKPVEPIELFAAIASLAAR
jgi:CheY-like chemotaxis protein